MGANLKLYILKNISTVAIYPIVRQRRIRLSEPEAHQPLAEAEAMGALSCIKYKKTSTAKVRS